MLTIAEMTDARDALRQAKALIERVRVVLLNAGDGAGARLLNGAVGLIEDEIAVLDKALSGGAP